MMKSMRKRKSLTVLFILLAMLIISPYHFNFKNIKVKKPLVSDHWVLTTPIVINGNDGWESTATTQQWCSGSGTWLDPYVIENVTINGLNSSNCILIQDSNVFFRIKNCTVYNSSYLANYAGIKFINVNNGTVIENNCSFNNFNGIYFSSSDNNTVSGNILNNNSVGGIYLGQSHNNTVIGNNASNNNNFGINLSGSHNNTVSGNTANNNTGTGISLSICDNNAMSGNTATNNGNYGILLTTSHFNKLSRNIASNNGLTGITISSSYNNTILENTVNNNGAGISIGSGSNNNTIAGNDAFYNFRGIYLSYSNSNLVYGNTAKNNTGNGIELSHSNKNKVFGNVVNNATTCGIAFSNSNNNTVSGNTVTSSKYGIFSKDCDNNTISGNKVINNPDRGIYLLNTNNSLVFKNAIIGNNPNAQDSSGIDNQWDNGVIGNYWDDFDGEDANNDGIGDSPYNISQFPLIQDLHPLFEAPFHNGSKIHIDEFGINALNWSRTALVKWWCTGSGTFSDPYIIEDLVIDGKNSSSCILIENSNVFFRIENCTVYNSGSGNYDAGFYLLSVSNGIIINNNASNNNYYGILLRFSDNNTVLGNIVNNNNIDGILLSSSCTKNYIVNNTANNNQKGINLMNGSHNNTISENKVNKNGQYGIFLSYSNLNTIIENKAYNNSIYGIHFSYSNNNTVSENLVINNTSNGIFLFHSNYNTVLGNSANNNFKSAIQFNYSNNNTVSENIANNNTEYGIYLLYSDDNMVLGNTVNNSDTGIYLDFSNNNAILRNNVSNNHVNGINLKNSNNNKVSINIAHNNSNHGIRLTGSFNNTIVGNLVTNNTFTGIYLWISNNNLVLGNTAYQNNVDGIYLGYYSKNNTIMGNSLFNNTINGIEIRNISNNNTVSGNLINYNDNTGIYIDLCNNTLLYNNSLIENNIHACDDGGINNRWDNGVIGNYWDNYTGSDANDDGIGDIPYNITGTSGSQDNLPIWEDTDDRAPEITIISPLNYSIYNVAPTFQLTVYDYYSIKTLWYSIYNGIIWLDPEIFTGNLVTVDYNVWNNLSDGNVLIRFYADDLIGHTNSKDVIILKDTIAPLINILRPSNNQVFGVSPPNFSLEVTDLHLDKMWYTIDNGITNITIKNFTETIDQGEWNKRGRGTVILTFYANDTLGSIGFRTVSIEKNYVYWHLNPIIINDAGDGNYTWEEASKWGWCSGIGTITDPYIIDSIIISGLNSTSCIEIRNSKVFFEVRNCVFINSGSGAFDAGIKLVNTSNGILTSNNCSMNSNFGIILIDCSNIIIQNSNMNSNSIGGIYLLFSNNNSIINNAKTINYNGHYGIKFNSSLNNVISRNRLAHNYYGIFLYRSNNTIVRDNFLIKNNKAIKEEECEGNIFNRNKIVNKNEQFSLEIIILIIVISGTIALSVSGALIWKKKIITKEERRIKRSKDKKEIRAKEPKMEQSHLINQLKQAIIEASTKYTRLEITDISDKTGIKDEDMIISVIQDMIQKSEIFAEYFPTAKAIAFDQQRKIEVLETLPKPYPSLKTEDLKKYTVFLSYSTKDSEYYELPKIVKGLECYPDIEKVLFWEADSTQNIVDFMEETLKSCNVFVLFCSENSVKSAAVKDEWQAAFQRRKKKLLKLIPVYEREEHIPAMLGHLLNVKYDKTDFDGFIEKLYKEIQRQ